MCPVEVISPGHFNQNWLDEQIEPDLWIQIFQCSSLLPLPCCITFRPTAEGRYDTCLFYSRSSGFRPISDTGSTRNGTHPDIFQRRIKQLACITGFRCCKTLCRSNCKRLWRHWRIENRIHPQLGSTTYRHRIWRHCHNRLPDRTNRHRTLLLG